MILICEEYKTKILEAAREKGWDYVWDKTRSCMMQVVDTLRNEIKENDSQESKSYVAFRRCYHVPHYFYFIHEPYEALEILKSEVQS